MIVLDDGSYSIEEIGELDSCVKADWLDQAIIHRIVGTIHRRCEKRTLAQFSFSSTLGNWFILFLLLITTGEQLAKEMECYFAEVAAAEQVSSIADAFNELGREVHSVRRRSKPPMSSSSTHSSPSLFDRMLGSRSSASIGSIRAYARGKSDSALPKD